MPAIGYDHPDQSHFNSRHFYEVGALQPKLMTGWLGRYLDRVGSPDNPLQGLALSGDLAPALATAKMPVSAIDGPGNYDFWAPGVWGEVEDWMIEAFQSMGQTHAGSRDIAMRAAGGVAVQSARLRQQLLPFGGRQVQSPVAYPTEDNSGFSRRLASLAAMIAGGLPLKCVALNAPGGYDTHDNQPQDLTDGLKATAEGLLAFQRDIEARGLADRVLVQVWSEFGRRGEENGSEGTDHGAAGLGMLIGTHARGQMVGEFPGLDPPRRGRQPADDLRLPGRLLRAAGAVVRARRERRDPGSGALRASGAGQVMRRVLRAAVVLAACTTLLVVTAVAGARRERPPARLMVSAREHSLVLSRQSIVAGPALVEFLNRGEDPHDLRMRRIVSRGVSARRTFALPETRSGGLVELEARLPAGRYKLWCSLPGHEALGMRAKLRVKRAR